MAGGSAQREYERRRDTRQRRIGRSRRRIVVTTLGAFVVGWFVPTLILTVAMSMLESIATGGDFQVTATQAPLALSAFTASALALMTGVRLLAPSQRELAWAKGAAGERAVGDALDELAASTPIVALHDRLIPNSRANIDHLIVTPSGVVTIDAKAYVGRLEVRGRGRELWIAGRNRSKLIDQAQRQRAVVVEALHRAGLSDVPVEAALCFVGTQFPRFFRPERVGEVRLTTPSRLPRLLTDGEPGMTDERRDRIVEALQRALRPAT